MADIEMKTARDPHHNGSCEWGWDGRDLHHRCNGAKWVKIRRIHPTPARIAILHKLMEAKDGR